MLTPWRHWLLALVALPGIVLDARQRRLLREMRELSAALPQVMATPLTWALAELTPKTAGLALAPATLRRLADLAALLDRQSPLGLCLRRALVRYHFLRRAGVPLVLNFGARFVKGKPDREVTGHAWVTLNGAAYFEDSVNYQGFTVMLQYPQE
jgi:hypothetical protein